MPANIRKASKVCSPFCIVDFSPNASSSRPFSANPFIMDQYRQGVVVDQDMNNTIQSKK